MHHGRSRTGLCILRIETQAKGVLITLRTNPDIEQVSGEKVSSVADVEAAVQSVREFLLAFVSDS
jgi:hypothetical protein